MSTIPMFAASDVPDLGAEPDRDTWTTMPELATPLERMARKLGAADGCVGLDPCTNERSIIRALVGWTRYDAPTAEPIRPWHIDGQRPHHRSAWCNWTWSKPEPWTRACMEETRCGNRLWVVGCGIADPSTAWFRHNWQAECILWPDHRIDFGAPPGADKSSNTHPIALPLWVAPTEAFMAAALSPELAHPVIAELRRRHIVEAFCQAFGHLGEITPKPIAPPKPERTPDRP